MANLDQLTVVAAWWGAITGSATLLFEFFKYIRGGPRLSVKVLPGMRLAGDFSHEFGSGCGWEDWPLIRIDAVNQGNSPTTVKLVAIHFFRSRIHKLLGKPIGREFCQALPIGPPLPILLAPGEEWVGMFRHDELMELEKFKIARHIYFTVEDNQSEKPRYVKLRQPNET